MCIHGRTLILVAALSLAGSISASGQLTADGSYTLAQGPSWIDQPETDDRFGAALAAGKLQGDVSAAAIIGVPGETVDVEGADIRCGIVLIAHASAVGPTTIISSRYTIDASPGTSCEEDGVLGERFGAHLSLGDFNGDGFPDIVIGIPGRKVAGQSDAGALLVGYGQALVPAASWQLISQPLAAADGGPETADEFGFVATSGNFNGDAYEDLAVGVAAEDFTGVNEGLVSIYYGSASGLPATPDLDLSFGNVANARGGFGGALAAADFDQDGRVDLAVGAMDRTVAGAFSAGSVFVFAGSDIGIAAADFFEFFQDDISSSNSESNDKFGLSLAAADFDGDTYPDLAIGAPGEDRDSDSLNSTGLVHIVHGSDTGLVIDSLAPNTTIEESDLGANTGVTAFDAFGLVLEPGNFNGDSFADLGIGVPTDDNAGFDDGVVYVLYGTANSLEVSSNQLWSQDVAGMDDVAETNDEFGFALAAADFTGSGSDGLLIGVPGEQIGLEFGAGLVHYLPSVADRLFADGFESGDTSLWQ